MAKQKKVSINTLEKITKEIYLPLELLDWHGVEVSVKHSLGLEEMMRFVNIVTSSCFADDGKYIPECKDFVVRNCILESYTNITLPANTSSRYDLIYKSDIVSEVIKHIDMLQFNAMIDAIDKKIDNLAQANIELINKKATELFNAIDNIQGKLMEVMSGVNPEDISKMVNSISNGTLDEHKLVEAYKSVDRKPKIVPIKDGES